MPDFDWRNVKDDAKQDTALLEKHKKTLDALIVRALNNLPHTTEVKGLSVEEQQALRYRLELACGLMQACFSNPRNSHFLGDDELLCGAISASVLLQLEYFSSLRLVFGLRMEGETGEY
ncbi:hypothetical protein Spico_0831 [Parasphaerochaeta coccoides DSM 17374]|uniref:Uncharacterized protein n=2 Tax=Parasphaerochaeta TaxID=3062336 RepID=F4GHU2_PARC1|nr:hypothetical protein Spico_0831 [Parasphaerochaeta coccoides DSM 17374]